MLMSDALLIAVNQIAKRAFSRCREDIIERLESDWKLYSRFAESDFRDKFNTILDELSEHISNKRLWNLSSDKLVNLWWEMHVGTYLINAGFKLIPNEEKPLQKNSPNLDHLFMTPNEERVWIECTQAARGSIPRELPGFDVEGYGVLPRESMMLRITNSLSEKASTNKCNSQINRFITAFPKFKDDCFIVAIGTGNLPGGSGDRFSPSVAYDAVFGLGNPTWTVQKDGSNCNFQGMEAKDSVLKDNKIAINTVGFLDDTFSSLAGLLTSHATPFLDATMCGIANPNAKVHLPDQFRKKVPTWSFDIDKKTILRPSQVS